MSFIIGHPEIKQVGTEGTGPLMEGKRILVTGASSGIGYGITERALQRGAAEVWICSRNEGRIKAAAEKLSAQYGDRVHWAAIDVRDGEALKQFADEMAAGGPIDFLFANAGVSVLRTFEQFDRETFDMVMEPNFYGIFNADQAVIKHMIRQGHGYILNVASMEGYIASGYHTAYAASKHAIMGLTEAMRYEYADRNIKVAVICPGPVRSNIWGKDPQGNLRPDPIIPDTVISELEAANEIFAGIEEERNIIIVTDTARMSWKKLHEAPESADRWIKKYTERNCRLLTTRG